MLNVCKPRFVCTLPLPASRSMLRSPRPWRYPGMKPSAFKAMISKLPNINETPRATAAFRFVPTPVELLPSSAVAREA